VVGPHSGVWREEVGGGGGSPTVGGGAAPDMRNTSGAGDGEDERRSPASS
jgi:hypothetical protein